MPRRTWAKLSNDLPNCPRCARLTSSITISGDWPRAKPCGCELLPKEAEELNAGGQPECDAPAGFETDDKILAWIAQVGLDLDRPVRAGRIADEIGDRPQWVGRQLAFMAGNHGEDGADYCPDGITVSKSEFGRSRWNIERVETPSADADARQEVST